MDAYGINRFSHDVAHIFIQYRLGTEHEHKEPSHARYFFCIPQHATKFSDRYAWANSADPDQTAPRGAVWSGSTPRSSLIWVYTVCHSICIVWTHYSMVEPHSSTFRAITTKFLGVQIFKKFTLCIFVLHVFMLDFFYYKWASSRENVSLGVSDQARHKPVSAATQAS